MTATRRYGGQTREERRRERRDRLIVAAIALYGRQGYRNCGVRAVCQEAALTERYFYESFANSEALLGAALDHVTDHLVGDLRTVASDPEISLVDRAQARLRAYYSAIREHPDAARVFLIEITGVSPAIDLAFDHAIDRLSELILDTYDPDRFGPAAIDPLLRRGVAGGLLHIALAWIAGGYVRDVDDVVAAATPLCILAAPSNEWETWRRPTNVRSDNQETKP